MIKKLVQITLMLMVAESLFAQSFVTRSADSLRLNGKRFYMRGVGMANYFLLDANDGSYDTEGFDAPWPSKDTDIPIEFSDAAQYSAGNFLDAAAMGFNVIRISMTYRYFENNSNPGPPYKQAGFDLIRDYIRWAEPAGIHIILDMHIPQGGLFGKPDLWEVEATKDRFVDMWQAIADTFKNETRIAAYDILNEPHPTSGRIDDNGDNAQWKALASEVVDRIRTVDTNHLIIVEGVNFVTGDDQRDLGDLDRYLISISDSNYMIDWHFYWPEAFVFESRPRNYPSTERVLSFDGSFYPFDKAFLRQETEHVKALADAIGVPINFGEWSGRVKSSAYKRDCAEIFQTVDVHWQYWPFNDLYENYDPRNIGSFEVEWFERRLESSIFIQGAYNTSTGEMSSILNANGLLPNTSPYAEDPRTVLNIPVDVTDWVLVQLRITPDGSAVASKSAFLHKDGRVVADDGTTHQITMSASPGSYYIAIKHRNHLAVMSAIPVDFGGSHASYDFTTASSQFFGSSGAKQLVPGIWGMWSGDIDQDGEVTTSDYTHWYNAVLAGANGYQITDLNLDAQVTVKDYTAWFETARAGASSRLP